MIIDIIAQEMKKINIFPDFNIKILQLYIKFFLTLCHQNTYNRRSNKNKSIKKEASYEKNSRT